MGGPCKDTGLNLGNKRALKEEKEITFLEYLLSVWYWLGASAHIYSFANTL